MNFKHFNITNFTIFNLTFLINKFITDVIRRFLRFSLGVLSSTQGVETIREDETTIAYQIRGKLSGKDAVQFDKLHNDLKDGVKIVGH